MYALTSRYKIIHPEHPCLGSRVSTVPKPDVSNLEHIGEVGSANVYANESLIEDLVRVHSLGGLASGSYFHATSSAALGPIAKHKALVSSKELIARGEPLVTGEITTDMGDHHRHIGGLEDVYVSLGGASRLTYCQVTGDAYPVIFGIKRQALGHLPPFFLIDHGDGIQAGKEIPLSCVTSLTAPLEKVPEAQEWADENCSPGTIAISWDVAEIMSFMQYNLTQFLSTKQSA